jgi:hypothetical protein
VQHDLLASNAAVAGGWRGTQGERTLSLIGTGCSRKSRGLAQIASIDPAGNIGWVPASQAGQWQKV